MTLRAQRELAALPLMNRYPVVYDTAVDSLWGTGSMSPFTPLAELHSQLPSTPQVFLLLISLANLSPDWGHSYRDWPGSSRQSCTRLYSVSQSQYFLTLLCRPLVSYPPLASCRHHGYINLLNLSLVSSCGRSTFPLCGLRLQIKDVSYNCGYISPERQDIFLKMMRAGKIQKAAERPMSNPVGHPLWSS